jgi:hypothetical protein
VDKEKLKKWLQDPRNRTLTIAVASMLLIILCVHLFSSPASEDAQAAESADTYIPEGFVLVPIDLQNSDSLSSLIGSYAVVDLFTGNRSKKVGKRLKLLRAPLNPQQFAVLVPEGEVSNLLANPGPFWAAIQNPQQSRGTEIASKFKKSRIEYFKGN